MKELKEKADKDSVLLINSMPGYFVYENIEEIARIAKEKDAVLINDASGSIGSEEGKAGDIIFGSTGRWKAINVHYGGFIATDMDYFNELGDAFDEKYTKLMLEKIESLDERTEKLRKQAEKVKNDLKDFDIIHRDSDGFNVVVKFSTDEEKEKILKYCSQNNYEHTICPRYIRVNEKAVCIEVKRNG